MYSCKKKENNFIKKKNDLGEIIKYTHIEIE